MKGHEYPKPMWHQQTGDIAYAANATKVDDMKKEGYQEQAIVRKFPMALHSSNNQGITVHNEAQLQQALDNGWSLKPVVDPASAEPPASFDRPPIQEPAESTKRPKARATA